MTTPDTFELLDFLKPISQESACGIDICFCKDDSNGNKVNRIKYTSTDIYYLYQQAIDCERQLPDKELGQDDYYFFRQSQPKWQIVFAKATQILTNESKDLYVIQIIIQALVRIKGFAGLRDGLHLTYDMIEKYWDKLYPLPDQEHENNPIWPLANLNGTSDANKSPLVKGIRMVSLINSPEQNTLSSVTCMDYLIKGDAFNSSITNYPSPEFFRALREDIDECLSYLEKLCQIIKEKYGSDKFSSSNIRQSLIDCRNALRILYNEDEITNKDQENTGLEISAEKNGIKQNFLQNNFTNREVALQSVLKVAEFLEKTEPHSPVPSLLRKAVRWSRMSYADLLKEMIADESACKKVFTLTGIDANSK